MSIIARSRFHTLRGAIPKIGAAACLVAFLAMPFTSNAATTVISVTGASNAIVPGATDPTTGAAATNTSVYGGLAGTVPGSPPNVFDTCANPTSSFAPCNSQAINPETILTFTIKSDKGGYPVLFPPSGGTSTVHVPPTALPALIPAGSQGSVSYRWGNICTLLSPSTNCVLTGAESTNPVGSFTIGVTANPGEDVAVSGETATVQFTIATIAPNQGNGDSTTGNLASGDVGLNEFEIGNGDSKVVLRNLQGTGVPQGSHLTFQYVRLLSVEASDENDALNAFSRITSASNKQDLLINTATSGEITLSPARVTGFTNDHWYAFKVAMVDVAGNVGYYTSSAANNDKDCSFVTATPTTQECHVGHPGEVVGVLSKDLNCFVATAAYGSQMAPQVETFRQFRNRFLLTADAGRSFVKFYYAHSPKYAHIIAQSPALRAVARAFLWPLLGFAWLALHFGLIAAFAISLLASALWLSLLTAVIFKLAAGPRAGAARA